MQVINKNIQLSFVLLISLNLFSSCKKYFDVELDTGKVAANDVFNDDKSAISALYGLYFHLATNSPLGGGETGISMLPGLSADELHNTLNSPEYQSFEKNQILASDSYINNLWTNLYQTIYQSNDILEGLESSTSVTDKIKVQLKGEALFCRAFSYFYLINLFGDVPLITTTDFRSNAKAPRVSTDILYDKIIADLKQCTSLLTSSYPEPERIRPNKYAAHALLSRIHLYRGEWEKAKEQTDSVVAQPDYVLQADLNSVFTSGSAETIWSLATEQNMPTRDGAVFIIEYGIGSATSELTTSLRNVFDVNDLRAQSWIGVYHEPESGADFYFPYKYKITYGISGLEHFVVFRLAEQFLIRAETCAQLGLLSESIAYLDKVRIRSGLDPLVTTNPTISKEDLLDLIMVERRRELFAEWGHRWFDLKRTDRATNVLQDMKADWSRNDMLYPIPQIEFNKNPFLGIQNPGY